MDSSRYGVFDRSIVKQINGFLKAWRIAPVASPGSDGADDFHFVEQPSDKYAAEFFEHDYSEQYFNIDPIPEWERLAGLTLFSGEFFKITAPVNYIADGDHIETSDSISRAFR